MIKKSCVSVTIYNLFFIVAFHPLTYTMYTLFHFYTHTHPHTQSHTSSEYWKFKIQSDLKKMNRYKYKVAQIFSKNVDDIKWAHYKLCVNILSGYRLKEDHKILMSTDGPYDNVLKFKPPMCFSKQNCDFLLEKLETLLAEIRDRSFEPSYRWTVIDASRPGAKVIQMKASL